MGELLCRLDCQRGAMLLCRAVDTRERRVGKILSILRICRTLRICHPEGMMEIARRFNAVENAGLFPVAPPAQTEFGQIHWSKYRT
jgi:hypothetical protein